MRFADNQGRPSLGVMSHPVLALVEDNVDPDELGRIKVKYPTLPDSPLSFWIRQSSPNGGKERGFYALPEKQDEVLVIYPWGNASEGVIIGQMWNGVDKPPKEAKSDYPQDSYTGQWAQKAHKAGSQDLAKNDRRFWRSRSGHLFFMDDTDGKESISVWDKSHGLALIFDTAQNLIVLANKEGDIEIRCKNDLILDAGNDLKMIAKMNIKVESGQETAFKAGTDFKVEATANIEGKSTADTKFEATANFSAKGTAGAKLEGTPMVEVKGAMAKLSGDALAEVMGGLVKLN